MRLHVLAALLVAALALDARAQATDTFPLGEDDRWTYGSVLRPPNAPPDTTRSTAAVRGSIVVRDTAYALATFPELWTDTLRTDDAGRVWARIAGRDQLYLDVTRADGETYTVATSDAVYTVTVTRDRAVRTGAGSFDDALEFAFDRPGTVDAAVTVFVAPGVGVVLTLGASGRATELLEARIDGALVLDGEGAPQRVPLRVHPNPVASRLTVELPSGRWSRVEVVDARGRTVATLLDGPCHACRATWHAGDAAPGLYLVRAAGAGGVAVRHVVRVR